MAETKAEAAAKARDGARCLRCHRSLAGVSASHHHRKFRSRAPKRLWDLVENVVILCGSGTTGCHGWVHHNPSEAEYTGWTVPSWADPATISLIDLAGGTFYLRADGTRTASVTEDDPWLSGHGNTTEETR